MTLINLSIPQNEINRFCQRWQIARLEIFGSAIREDFNADSDIDLLVEYKPTRQRSLTDMEQMQVEIENILQRPVDLITKKTIECSPNPYKRNNILNHTLVIYE